MRSLTRISATPPVPEYADATTHCGPSATKSSGACWPQTTSAAGVQGGGGGCGGGCALSGSDAMYALKTSSSSDAFTTIPPNDLASFRAGYGPGGSP